jgi:hypothetical protein
MIRFLCITGLSILGLVFGQAPAPTTKSAQQKQPAKTAGGKAPAETKQETKSAQAPAAPKAAEPAQPSKTNTGKPAPKANTAGASREGSAGDADGQIVKVTIETSRPEVTTGGGYGIYADLQNLKSDPVTLYPRETTLVVQPELADKYPCVFELNGFFPTETNPSKEFPLGRPIVIQPKEHYRAFWDMNGEAIGLCQGGQEQSWWPDWIADRMRSSKNRLAFMPGDYAFVVVGKAYVSPEGKAETKYHTFTQDVKLHVGITQMGAITAAVLGGIIGYIVMALRKDGDFAVLWKKPDGKPRHWFWYLFFILRNGFSAALLSAVVTVILSRISDTQFPIKVTVSDFWGALTIGFVAYFTGNNLINRIVGLASKQGGGTPGTP